MTNTQTFVMLMMVIDSSCRRTCEGSFFTLTTNNLTFATLTMLIDSSCHQTRDDDTFIVRSMKRLLLSCSVCFVVLSPRVCSNTLHREN